MRIRSLVWGLLLALTVCQAVHGQIRIDAVEFRGLERTRTDFLMQFLQSQQGTMLDEDQVASDEQTLHNLQLFASVTTQVIPDGNTATLVFNVQERLTRIPITNFGGIRDNFWFQLGINEYNWLGRGGYFGGYYQFYDRHSFKVFQQLPQLFGPRLGLTYTVGRQATLEPVFFQGTSSEFDVDRWEITGLLRYEIYRNLEAHSSIVLEAGGGYLHEVYEQRPGDAFVYTGDTRFDKYFVTAKATFQHLNYNFYKLDGMSISAYVQQVGTWGVRDMFWKGLMELKMYRSMGDWFNPALRIRAGVSSNDDSPFVPFVLDSYLNVRGSGNRVARGTSEFTVNLEHRQRIFVQSMWAMQLVGFIDTSSWRPAGAPLKDMFLRENTVTFGGGGVRIHFQRIYNFTLRADYGVNLFDREEHGIVLGVGQYF